MNSADWTSATREAEQAFADGSVLTQPRSNLERWLLALCLSDAAPGDGPDTTTRRQREALRHLIAARLAEPLPRHPLEMFGELYGHVPLGVVVFLSHGEILEFNAAFAAVVGCGAEELRRSNLAALMDAADRTVFFREVHKVSSGAQRAVEVDVGYARSDGQQVWAHHVISPLPEGASAGLIAFVSDVTRRRQLEESMRRYEMLAQHSRDIVLFMQRDSGRFLEVNTAAVRAYGYSRDEFLQLTIHDLRAPNTQPALAEQMSAANMQGILFETAHRRRDGTEFPVEVSSQGATIAGEQTLISVVRDITARKKAEHALRVSEEKFAKAFATNPAAIILTRLEDGRIIEVNQTWVEMFGFARSEVVGRSSLELNVWPSFAQRTVWSEELRRKHTFRNREQTLRRRSGELMITLGSAELLQVGDDELVLSTWLDITDLKRAEDALRASEQLCRGVITHASTGIAILNRAGEIQTCNPAFCRLVGYAEGELRSVNMRTLVHPDDVARNLEQAELLLSGAVASFENQTRYLRRDGRHVWVEKFVCLLPDGQGQRSLMVLATDVTERRHAEEQLRLASQRFETALATGPIAVFNMDRELRYTWIHNPLSGLKPEHFVGRRDADLMGDPAQVAVLDMLKQEVLLSGAARRREVVVTLNGIERVLDMMVQPQRDSAGAIIGVTCAAVDITERKRTEQELLAAQRAAEAANSAKDHFLAVLSHELRTPLTPVLAAMDLLQADASLSAEHEETLRMIRRNVELEARLIDDLLDLTRISRNKLELHLDFVDVHEKIRHVLHICEEEITAKRLTIATTFEARHRYVHVDPARFQQIVWNVVKNAVKFSRAGGLITIRTGNPGPGQLAVQVGDEGAGIAPDVLPKIFDAFEQGGRHITRQFGGLGLGLAISKALVEAQGGQITAESAGVGRGAAFTVALPTAQPPAATPALHGSTREAQLACNILLVEDHVDTLRVMSRLLRAMGCRVTTAACVAEALTCAAREKFDVVVSDIGLPDASGIDLMRELRERQGLKGIALSGYGMDEDMARSKEAGFAAHLRKPVNLKLLETTIRQLTA